MPIGRLFALSSLLALLGLAAFVAYHELGYRRLARGLDEDVATLRRTHWERPVLRGPAGDGNAAAAAFAALADFPPLDPALREALAERVHYGQPLSAAEQAAIATRQRTLRALRAASQQGWAFSELAVERGRQMAVPSYPRVLEAGLCLLADARGASPDECLRVAADVIRLGQDLVPGAPLEAATISARLTALAAKLVPRCASGADLPTLRRAVREITLLATHPPPTGSGIELAELARAAELRDRLALANKRSPGEVIHTLLERPSQLAAWSVIEHPTRFRKLGPASYPEAVETFRREQEYRARTSQPFGDDGVAVIDALREDMRAQALVRMLAVGLATQADRVYRGKLPSTPAMLDEPGLEDPFRGGPLSYRISSGGELSLWAVGEDRNDDGGSSEWRAHAPIDVVLRFPLKGVQHHE